MNPKPIYHQCDQFHFMFIFIYVKSYWKVNKSFWKHEFHDVLVGNQVFKKYFYVSWLMDYQNMIWVLHLNSIILFKWPSTINMTNFAIPLFTWINMYNMIYWTWNKFFLNVLLFHGLRYYCNVMWVLFSFYVLVWM